MIDAQHVVSRLLETDWSKAEQAINQISQNSQDAASKWLKAKQAIQRHPQASQFKSNVDQLDRQYQKRDQLMAHARYAISYRKALARVGLTIDDVARKFGKSTGRQWWITQVETKDGRRITIQPVLQATG